ncbi:hypothetical protein HPB47_020016 [Ixodes persulcatus]|uniref:Uncharacterized protein n=1 Tax=Ixodes persulcatus TaxID=34615 RepID=A0AC60QIJ4_IXOPE|nr:hypothetical protein HPB47_020016 [Ixodes persulcatus]
MSIFALNVYSPPSRRKENFAYLLPAIFKLAKQNGVIVLGHFNTAHPARGTTRIGSCVSRDTGPDLTMTEVLADAEWCNTEETLGSDHCILITTVTLIRKNSFIKKTRLVNWDEFRKQRKTTSTSEITSFDECKHNRTLKVSIPRLTEEAAHYAVDLMQQNKQQFCNSLQGTLGTAKTWSLLRHLLDPTKSKRHGLKEEDATHLIQALIISRVTYSAPYLTIKPREREKLEVLNRRYYKQAFGLPLGTSTPRLLSLGIHNTVEERIEAHVISQRERLKLAPAGRQVLTRLGYPIQTLGHSETITLTAGYRTKISAAPIPKNMHPEFNQGRRQARARALQKKLQYTRHIRCTDATSYPGRLAMAVSVIDEDMREMTTATVPTSLPLEREEAAIAIAITSTPAITPLSIITDSQAARRSFGNARALTLRAPPPQEDQSLVPIPIPLTYHDILQHLRLSRRTLPPPHKSLTREDAFPTQTPSSGKLRCPAGIQTTSVIWSRGPEAQRQLQGSWNEGSSRILIMNEKLDSLLELPGKVNELLLSKPCIDLRTPSQKCDNLLAKVSTQATDIHDRRAEVGSLKTTVSDQAETIQSLQTEMNGAEQPSRLHEDVAEPSSLLVAEDIQL